MKIVIDIPEEIYQHYKKVWQKRRGSIPESCIANGTPLPQEEEQLIVELSKMPPTVIETAYLYAINYTKYGENVTEKWVTAVQQTSILEKVYRQGYYNALLEQGKQESEDNDDKT